MHAYKGCFDGKGGTLKPTFAFQKMVNPEPTSSVFSPPEKRQGRAVGSRQFFGGECCSAFRSIGVGSTTGSTQSC